MINPETVLGLESINYGGEEDGVSSQDSWRCVTKSFTPLLKVLLYRASFLDKETRRGAVHNLVTALVLSFHRMEEGSRFSSPTLLAAHALNQVFAALMKALQAALTQNLTRI